jgi:hypothetical protein
MTLITFQDGRPVLRDGKVGTEQECCCGGCGCVYREGSLVVVTAGGVDATVNPFCLPYWEGVCNGSGEICVSAFTLAPDGCETRFFSSSQMLVFAGCHSAAGWFDNGPVPIPENWPDSGIVVAVREYWATESAYHFCSGPRAGGQRYLYYRMVCDSEGYPTTGELFFDSGVENILSDGSVPDESAEYICTDLPCTNQPELNRDCETLPTPSSVIVVVNPFP